MVLGVIYPGYYLVVFVYQNERRVVWIIFIHVCTVCNWLYYHLDMESP